MWQKDTSVTTLIAGVRSPILPVTSSACSPKRLLYTAAPVNSRPLKRQKSNTADDDLVSLPLPPVLRRVVGKQPKPAAWFSFTPPCSIQLGQDTATDIPGSFSGKGAQDYLEELMCRHGLEELKARPVSRNTIRHMQRMAFMLHHRNYCETFLSSRRCPDSIKNSLKGMGTKISLCADKLISELTPLQTMELFRKMIVRCQQQQLHESLLDILGWLSHHPNKMWKNECDTRDAWMHAKTGLLTYNGVFGVISSTYYKGLMKRPKLLCKALSKNKHVVDLMNELKNLALSVRLQYHLTHVSAAIELCEHTLLEEGVIRVHAHIMLEGAYGKRIRIVNPESIAFQGSLPVKSNSTLASTIGTVSHKSAATGHYYLMMPKTSGILKFSTCKPNEDYRVNPDHIMAFVQSGKMCPDDAKIEILKTFKDSEKTLSNVRIHCSKA